jgi:tyrosyl-tRNA synthetase
LFTSIFIHRTFESIEELEKAYIDGSLHPGDLKPALATAINEMIEPVRTHFKTNEEAKKLLATIKRYQQAAAKTSVPVVATPPS